MFKILESVEENTEVCGVNTKKLWSKCKGVWVNNVIMKYGVNTNLGCVE